MVQVRSIDQTEARISIDFSTLRKNGISVKGSNLSEGLIRDGTGAASITVSLENDTARVTC